jgi:hypothetical protein
MCVDETGLIFYLVYEFERLRLLPGLDRSISNNCSSSNRTNNARAGFAPDELLGSGTTQPRPCIISSNTFATDKGQCDRSLARSAWDCATPTEPSRKVRYDRVQLIPELLLVEMCTVFLWETSMDMA